MLSQSVILMLSMFRIPRYRYPRENRPPVRKEMVDQAFPERASRSK